MKSLIASLMGPILLSSCNLSEPDELVATTPGSQQPRPSRIVVALVVDQLALWHVEERFHTLPENGGFKRLLRESEEFVELRYGHVQTSTAIGHAALFTGLPPRESRVVANEVPDRDHNVHAIVRDERTKLVTAEGIVDRAGASLAVLPNHVETLADALRRQRPEVSIACLSLKDRGAVFACGRTPDAVAWFDVGTNGFVSSNAYGPTMPSLLLPYAVPLIGEEYQATNWTPLDPTWLNRNAPPHPVGQGNFEGLGRGFPHELWKTDRPARAMLATPMGDALLTDATIALLDRLPERQDAFLAVSFSSYDYIHHIFGPDSEEAWDELLRLDGQLARLFDKLDSLYGTNGYSIVLSADHGGPQAPSQGNRCGAEDPFERACGQTIRLHARDLYRIASTAAARAVGPGRWIGAVSEPFVHFSEAAEKLTAAQRTALVAEVSKALSATPGVSLIVDSRNAAAQPCPGYEIDSMSALVCRSTNESTGDLLIVPTPEAFFDTGYVEGEGCNHGSPYRFDRAVPMFVRTTGERVHKLGEAFKPSGRVDPRAYSATLAALLKIGPPAGAEGGEDLSW